MHKSFINSSKKYAFKLALGVSSVALVVMLLLIAKDDQFNQQTFQKQFLEREQAQTTLLNQVKVNWENFSREDFFNTYYKQHNELIVHVYESDSLIFWNSNKFPIGNFADSHFPVNGLVKLQNGWYYSKTISQGKFIFAVSFGIKRHFPISNGQLDNYFFSPFKNIKAVVSPVLNSESTIIKNISGASVFSIEQQADSESANSLYTFIFLDILLLISLIIYSFVTKHASTPLRACFALLSLICIRLIFLYYPPFSWMENSALFDPTIFALNAIIPNFGELLIWVLFLVLISPAVKVLVQHSNKVFVWSVWVPLIPITIMIFPQLLRLILINSTIPIHLGNILQLSWISAILIIIIGTLWSLLFLFYQKIIAKLSYLTSSSVIIWFVTPAIFIGVILANERIFRLHGFWIIWMFATLLLALSRLKFKERSNTFSWYLVALLILSTGITLNLETEAKKKEKEERILLANQLVDERDMNAEIDYNQAKEKLREEPYLKRLFIPNATPSFSELKEAMEYQVFNGYWDRYDVDFYYFNYDSIAKPMNGVTKQYLDELIENHGTQSEIDSSLYYIKDYTSQYNYIFSISLEKEEKKVELYGTMRSKRIPEKIGFPRILVSKQTAVYNLLEDYSIAKYYNNKLVFQNGTYKYPTNIKRLSSKEEAQNWVKKDQFNHLIIKKSQTDAIVLSYEDFSILSYLTSIAFLMTCFGLLIIPVLFITHRNTAEYTPKLTLVTKIQLAFVGLIIVSLIGFTFVSSTLFSNQYSSFSNEQTLQKEASILEEIKNDDVLFSSNKSIENSEELNYKLRKWSRVFSTDINVFGLDGKLVGTSRNKIYNLGLLSEQINPNALKALKYQESSEFLQRENIGKLFYQSGYTPIYNHDRIKIGYLNVLHFNQHNNFEEQLKQFFVNILNIFMLLLVLSVITAYLASTWIIKPLILLKKNFAAVQFGKTNTPINYPENDEIGSLVNEYNKKLEELEVAAKKLLQSERESAWREMAKQVAHEIKNPLTPMKLSVQHLKRIYDPNDPNMQEKVNKTVESLTDQIDALTTIANEFSNFAKLPIPILANLNFAELCSSAISFFDSNEDLAIKLINHSKEELIVFADKDMILRVLNNLITNGIQAVEFQQKAEIILQLYKNESSVILLVTDNGKGILSNQVETIFEPYFTTKSTGTGLGLAMVKQIIELHNGSIAVKETSAKGTTIELVLPLT